MGDTTGPISTLPGTGHDLPDGTTCEEHPDRPAVARIQGETDSFGCEMIDMCQECLDEYREDMRNGDHSGICEWCKEEQPLLRPTRDHEEGMYGRVYYVCDGCIKRRDDEDEKYLGTYWDDGE